MLKFLNFDDRHLETLEFDQILHTLYELLLAPFYRCTLAKLLKNDPPPYCTYNT